MTHLAKLYGFGLRKSRHWTSELRWPSCCVSTKNAIGLQMMLTVDYRMCGFRMSLIGSDGVVRSYSDLMQFFFKLAQLASQTTQTLDSREVMSLLGTFLLEIRKSTGNESTELDNWNMLEWFISDARKIRPE